MAHNENRPNTNTNTISFVTDHRRTRCEVWTRVMGYHRPVSSFNIGKKGEFNERQFFTESNKA